MKSPPGMAVAAVTWTCRLIGKVPSNVGGYRVYRGCGATDACRARKSRTPETNSGLWDAAM